MTLEDIVERTDPNLIKIFNIKNNTRSAKIKHYIQKKETGEDAEQITSEVRAEYVYHQYGLEDGQLDPCQLLSRPDAGQLELPAPLRDEDKYKQHPGIEGAIDIALQYPHRINTTDEALEKLIDEVVQNPGRGNYTRLDAAIHLLSHDELDNEKYKKTREQIIEMFREKVFFHHYGLEDGKLDPCQLLSKPDAGELKLPTALRDEGQIEDQDRKDEGLWKKLPGIEGAIDIALQQYPHRIDTSDEALEELINSVVQNPGRGKYTRLDAAIYFLDKLVSYKTKNEITRDLYIKTLRYRGFIDGEHIRSESVRSHPVVNGKHTPLKMAKPFQQYVPRNTRAPNGHDKLMMAYDLAINEGFKCDPVLATEEELGKMHKAYGMEGVKAWHHFNLHINRDEFSDQSKNWIMRVIPKIDGVLD